MQYHSHLGEVVVCGCGSRCTRLIDDYSRAIVGKFNLLCSCININQHPKVIYYNYCCLCKTLYENAGPRWDIYTQNIKDHLKERHGIHTNANCYLSVNDHDHTILANGIRASLPNFISMYVQSNIVEDVTDAIDGGNDEKLSHYEYINNRFKLTSIEYLEFACTICGKDFDSISKEIFKEHLNECILAHYRT